MLKKESRKYKALACARRSKSRVANHMAEHLDVQASFLEPS
jgi:hypothetical protein